MWGETCVREETQEAAGALRRAARPRFELLEDRWLLSVYQVTNNNDDGSVGSLPWAVNEVNANPDVLQGDVIALAPTLIGGQTITLGSTLSINAASTSLTISDQGAPPVTLNGNNAVQIINSSRDLVLDSLTIANGAANSGAGIYGTENVAADHCIFTGDIATGTNATAFGGAIDAAGVTANNCTFSNDFISGGAGDGGAIHAAAVLTANCVFSNDSSGGGFDNTGGAISGTNVSAINCIFSGDSASDAGEFELYGPYDLQVGGDGLGAPSGVPR